MWLLKWAFCSLSGASSSAESESMLRTPQYSRPEETAAARALIFAWFLSKSAAAKIEMQSRAPPDPRTLGLRRRNVARVESAFIIFFFELFFFAFCVACAVTVTPFSGEAYAKEREAEKTEAGEHVQRQTAKRIISNNLVLLHHVSKPSKKGWGWGKGNRRGRGRNGAKGGAHKVVCQRLWALF